jgi:tRNA(adenine34) deaminase
MQGLGMGSDASGMDLALAQARLAAERGEIPVGAILSDAQGNIVSAQGNAV